MPALGTDHFAGAGMMLQTSPAPAAEPVIVVPLIKMVSRHYGKAEIVRGEGTGRADINIFISFRNGLGVFTHEIAGVVDTKQITQILRSRFLHRGTTVFARRKSPDQNLTPAEKEDGILRRRILRVVLIVDVIGDHKLSLSEKPGLRADRVDD
jgi:hypothetical protein